MALQEVRVQIDQHAYTVGIGTGALSSIGTQLRDLGPEGSRVVVVSDTTAAALYGDRVMLSLDQAGMGASLWKIPAGETSKCLAELEPLLSFLAQQRLNRDGIIVALGGGVTGDLAGFAAAIYQRGVMLVQAPTTLLAMVDSSVGGKTGINLPEGKNLVGSFHQPSLVIADLDTLQSLPRRELAAGMAEVIKYGCILDLDLFRSVASGLPADWAPIIRRCVELKAGVVQDDPFELNGGRARLNFGHTLGHAIENAAGYGRLLHGEAVAIGMRAAAHLSRKKCGLDSTEVEAIERALIAHGLPLTVQGLSREAVRSALKLDKKSQAGVNRWILIPSLGTATLRSDIDATDVEELLDLVLIA